MAIQKAVAVVFECLADGTSTSFSVDLTVDAYTIAGGASGAPVQNWFTENRKFPSPSGVFALGPAQNGFDFSVSLSGTIVTVTFASAPTAGRYTPVVLVLFP
jgi:hypothetical protein